MAEHRKRPGDGVKSPGRAPTEPPSDSATAAEGALSRRSFLRGGAAGALATGAATLLPAHAEGAAANTADAEIGAKPVGPGPVAITLDVNGREVELEVEPRVTLLDALRDRLDVTGPKKVCDRGTCGACTVLRDGKPVYACSVLAIESQGSKLVTVEGLGDPENMHPVQAAFVEQDAQQCGFCTPGFVVATAALLDANPSPTADQVRDALGGNLCRCGTYAGIRKVVGLQEAE